MVWQTPIEKIGEIHFDLTNLCNAACPECSRTLNPESIQTPSVLNFDYFDKWFKKEQLKDLAKINLCGTYGDPLTHPKLFDIIEFFSSNFYKVPRINIATNGGLKNVNVWKKLATYNNVQVCFGIDGLQDTNEIYRKNVNWNKLQTNFRAYIDNGGYAIWQFIVFPWNEHQINEVKQYSKDWGFKALKFIRSHRNDNADYSKKTFKDKTNKQLVIAGQQIKCEVQNYLFPSIYILNNGLVYPCCFLGAQHLNEKTRTVDNGFETKLSDWYTLSGGQQTLSLYNNSLYDILNGDFFTILQESFTQTGPLGACGICERTCKKKVDRDNTDVTLY